MEGEGHLTEATDAGRVAFGPFTVDFAERQLRRDGAPVELGSRYFDALALMLRHPGALVSKDRFMDEVWRGVPVTDEALTQCIRTLRRALDDDAGNPAYIATVPKHGYRFVGEIGDTDSAVVARHLAPSLVAGSCALAGLGAGLAAGLLYGVVAGTGGAGAALTLAALVGALGLLAGAGVGAGLAATLAWRGRADPVLLGGGALGGIAVGALGSLLGREGVGLLTGRSLGAVTGPFEGLLLGLAVGAAAWLALKGKRPSMVVAAALASGALAGAAIQIAGGALLNESLWAVQRGLPDTQLAMERLGAGAFGAVPQAITAIMEGAAFTAALALALIRARR